MLHTGGNKVNRGAKEQIVSELMVATLAALVLGLLIGFATDSFNKMRSEVQHTAAKLILLDRVLAPLRT